MNEQTDYVVRIPLRDKTGSIVDYTLIDSLDAGWANRWRWSLDDRGYACRGTRFDGRNRVLYLHRELLGLQRGDRLEGDHINRDRLDNRRANLRVVTRGQNGQNKPSYAGSSSRFRGVSWRKHAGKWQAYVRSGGRMKSLGYFADEAEAAAVASAARRTLLPFAVEDDRAYRRLAGGA